MNDEKDRVGTFLHKKEQAEGDQYSAQRDRELIAQLKHQHEAAHEQTVRELSQSRCPDCGKRLRRHTFHQMLVAECPQCLGVWFSKEEVQSVFRRYGEDWMEQFLAGLSRVLTHPAGFRHEE